MSRTKNESRANDIRSELDDKAKSLMRAEERAREISIDNLMKADDPLYFPPEKVPFGWVYGWIAIAILEVPNTNHERNKMKQGWSPVPASRHPEEARNHLDVNAKSDVIVRRGLMLCEIPKAIHDKIIDKRQNDQQSMMKSLRHAVEQMPSDPTIPASVFENTDDVTSRFGRTFGN